MGDIIPFVARVRDSGDWTAAERARLDALADHFAGLGIEVDVVFGATDDGDPWCVIKDANEDVLLHVARIDGRFVVHYAADDSLTEAADLPAALSGQLILLDEPRGAEVLPFAVNGRQGQMLIALLVATAFFYDTREAKAEIVDHAAPHGEAADLQAVTLAVAAADLQAPRHDRELAVQSAAAAEPAPQASHLAATPAPAPAAPAIAAEPAAPEPAEPPARASVAPPPGETLNAATTAEMVHGGAGGDTLAAADDGRLHVIDGGAGDDHILVTSHVVAIGGAGADTFEIATAQVLGEAATLLGFILDFHAAEGDRLVTHHGELVRFLGEDGHFTHLPPPTPETVQDTRVFVDLNGDGRPDGFLVMGNGAPPSEHKPDERPPPPLPHEAPAGAPPVTVHVFGVDSFVG